MRSVKVVESALSRVSTTVEAVVFLLTVNGVFTIAGSTTVTGKVARGQAVVGDALVLRKADGTELTTEVVRLNTGDDPIREGDAAGVSLKDVPESEVHEGDQLVGAGV